MNNLTDLIRSQIRAIFGRRALAAVIFVAAIGVTLFAAAFLLMAAQTWLSDWYLSQTKADLTIGGALALMALAAAIAGEIVRRSPAPEARTPASFALAIPLAAKIAPRLLNRRFLGVASVVLGAILIGREFSKK
jgi:hypothetical protein